MNMRKLFFFILPMAFFVSTCEIKSQKKDTLKTPTIERFVALVDKKLGDPNPNVTSSNGWDIDYSNSFFAIITNPEIEGEMSIEMLAMIDTSGNLIDGDSLDLTKATDETMKLIGKELKTETPLKEKIEFQGEPAYQFMAENQTKKHLHIVFLRKGHLFMASLQTTKKDFSKALETATPVLNSLDVY